MLFLVGFRDVREGGIGGEGGLEVVHPDDLGVASCNGGVLCWGRSRMREVGLGQGVGRPHLVPDV